MPSKIGSKPFRILPQVEALLFPLESLKSLFVVKAEAAVEVAEAVLMASEQQPASVVVGADQVAELQCLATT